jgi:hypothetical protein
VLALALTFACSNFSGEEPPTPFGSDAAEEDVGPLPFDGTQGDTQGPDATPLRCSGFDVDAASQPPSSVCDGLPKNLVGDPKNCGLCGHACLDSLVCENSICKSFPIVGGSGGAELQRVDDTDIYWVDRGRSPNAVFRASSAQASSQSTAAQLAEVSMSEPVSMGAYNTLVDDRIYLKTYFTLYQAPLDGGPLTVFTTQSADVATTPLATSGDHLLQTGASAGVFIDFAKRDGGLIAKQTAIGGAYDLTVTPDGRYAFVIGRSAVDAGMVDGSAITRGALYRYTIATQDMTLVATIDAMPAGGSVLTADRDYVYFPEALAGSILQLAVDAPPGTIPTVLSKGDGRRVGHITTDENRVYWFSSKDPPDYYFWDLLSVDKCGGAERTHLRAHDVGSFLPSGLIVRGPYVYYASQDSIFRIAK